MKPRRCPDTGKRMYGGPALAQAEIERISAYPARAKVHRGPMSPYRCHACTFWHIGHDVPRRLRAAVKA